MTGPDRDPRAGEGKVFRGTVTVQAKYLWGSLILYLLGIGIVAAIHPSGNSTEVVVDGLLWPLTALKSLLGSMSGFYGRAFD